MSPSRSTIRLQHNDAWFLLAVAACGLDRASPLAHVLAAADMINHAVPLRDEIEESFTRLLQAGLIAISPDRQIGLTAEGRSIIEETGSKTKAWLNQWDLLSKSKTWKTAVTRTSDTTYVIQPNEWPA